MFPQMEPIPPTGYARLAVLEHIPRVSTKIHAHHGQIAALVSTLLRTAQAAPIVYAPLGQLALQAKR